VLRRLRLWITGAAEHDQIVSFLRARPIVDDDRRTTVSRCPLGTKASWADGHVDLDIVGTGGVRRPRHNVSTTVAFILAALGIRVAKHGNRGSVKANGASIYLSY